MASKECLQLSRDRLTAILLISVPLAQILLFGFAIDLSPKRWPAAWFSSSPEVRQSPSENDREIQTFFIQALNQTGWVALEPKAVKQHDALRDLQSGKVRFVFEFPETPEYYLHRNLALPVTIRFDGSDPYVAMTAMQLTAVLQTALSRSDSGNKADKQVSSRLLDQISPAIDKHMSLHTEAGAIELHSVAAFPAVRSSGAYLVPALTGVILTLTLTLMAAFSLVREGERGTWVSLMSTPVNASLIVFGKLIPYAMIGIILSLLLQLVSHQFFATPWASSAQWFAVIFFILGQLGLGACLSLLAKTQMQAMQLGIFFYLPSILLSGFMFPFHAMPGWAKTLGEVLPLTHFLRVQRADLFRQADAMMLIELSLPIVLFAITTLGFAILGYRRQLH